LKAFWVSDSVAVVRFATGADHDGAAQSRSGATFLFILDLSWARAELAPYYPQLGRPSIDPVLMIRMLIVGYVFAIRWSGRYARMCE
jgi:hypothetical protein